MTDRTRPTPRIPPHHHLILSPPRSPSSELIQSLGPPIHVKPFGTPTPPFRLAALQFTIYYFPVGRFNLIDDMHPSLRTPSFVKVLSPYIGFLSTEGWRSFEDWLIRPHLASVTTLSGELGDVNGELS
jgi:hypothetical protein